MFPFRYKKEETIMRKQKKLSALICSALLCGSLVFSADITAFAAAEATYMNHATYTKNGAAFLSSDNKAQFLANEWMSAQKKIQSETNTINSNMGDKEGQYHRVQELVNPPLIKTGTIKEEYRDANGTIKIESEGMHAGGVFREEGYAVVNQDKGSTNKQILETRYGVTDSFDYIIYSKRTVHEDGSWVAQSQMVIGDSNDPNYMSYYANILTRCDANGNVSESVRGIAVNDKKEVRNVENVSGNGDNTLINYKIDVQHFQLGSAISAFAKEDGFKDIQLFAKDENGNVIDHDLFGDTGADVQIQCLNDGIDISQCSIPSFLKRYSELKAAGDYEGIAKLTSEVISQDTLKDADSDESNINGLFDSFSGKTTAAGVGALGMIAAAAWAYKRQDEEIAGFNDVYNSKSSGSAGGSDDKMPKTKEGTRKLTTQMTEAERKAVVSDFCQKNPDACHGDTDFERQSVYYDIAASQRDQFDKMIKTKGYDPEDIKSYIQNKYGWTEQQYYTESQFGKRDKFIDEYIKDVAAQEQQNKS